MNNLRVCLFLLLGVVIEVCGLTLEEKTSISSETMICMTIFAFFFLKKPCTLGIIHRSLYAACIPVEASVKAPENQKFA